MTKYDWLIKLAATRAKDSDDPRTHVGAVVYEYGSKEAICSEPNQLSRGFTLADLEIHDKYAIMLHAEQAALYEYLKRYWQVRSIGLAVTAACCTECAKAIVAAGVKEVITSRKAIEAMPTWKEEIEKGHQILKQAGIDLFMIESVGAEVLISGEMVVI